MMKLGKALAVTSLLASDRASASSLRGKSSGLALLHSAETNDMIPSVEVVGSKRALGTWDCLHFSNQPHDLDLYYDYCYKSGSSELAIDVTIDGILLQDTDSSVRKECLDISSAFISDPANQSLFAKESNTGEDSYKLYSKDFTYGNLSPSYEDIVDGKYKIVELGAYAKAEPTELFNKFNDALQAGYAVNHNETGLITGLSIAGVVLVCCGLVLSKKSATETPNGKPVTKIKPVPSAPDYVSFDDVNSIPVGENPWAVIVGNAPFSFTKA